MSELRASPQFRHGHLDWNLLGRARQQTLPQFHASFSTTQHIDLKLGPPVLGGAAGSIYAEVPALVLAKDKNGATRAQCGTYTLRQLNVPPFQAFGWHIEGQNLAPVTVTSLDSPEAQRLLSQGCK